MKTEAEPRSNGATKGDSFSMLQYIKMVLWAFLGIRHSASASLELGSLRPLYVIVCGLIIAVLLVALLMGLASIAGHFV